MDKFKNSFRLCNLFFICIVFVSCNNSNTSTAIDKPNVLFISIDDLNDWTGFMGGHPQAQTPNLDRLADSGISFTYAYPPAPSCGPSRTAILYGRHPHVTGAYGNDEFYSPQVLRRFGRSTAVPDMFMTQKALPAIFNENGYYTAGAGKLSHFTQTPRYSQRIASYFADQFDVFYGNPSRHIRPDPDNPGTDTSHLSFGPAAPEDEEKMLDTRYSNWAVEQLQKDHDTPFFIAVGFEKPHLPWVAPQSYFDRFDQLDLKDIRLPEVPADDFDDIPHAGKIFAQSIFFFDRTGFRQESGHPESHHQYITRQSMLWQRLVRAYLATTTYVDAMLGDVLDALEESPYAENTIVVVWGDHGWHLGEKQHWRKFTMWERSSRVPFIIRLPDNSSNGQSVDHPVSLQDIFPTLVELLDLEIDQTLDGNSLVPLLENPVVSWDKPALMVHGPGNFAVRLQNWRYIRYQNGDEELYDMENDPKEFTNLAAGSGYEQVIEELASHIPDNFVKLYNHRSLQFTNLDTMKVFGIE